MLLHITCGWKNNSDCTVTRKKRYHTRHVLIMLLYFFVCVVYVNILEINMFKPNGIFIREMRLFDFFLPLCKSDTSRCGQFELF